MKIRRFLFVFRHPCFFQPHKYNMFIPILTDINFILTDISD